MKIKFTAKIPYGKKSHGEVSLRQCVLTAKCRYGEASSRRNVLTEKCPYGKVSVRRGVRTASCPYGETSYGEISYGEKSYGKKSGHGSGIPALYRTINNSRRKFYELHWLTKKVFFSKCARNLYIWSGMMS